MACHLVCAEITVLASEFYNDTFPVTVFWWKGKRLHIQRHAWISYPVIFLLHCTKWSTGFEKPLCLGTVYISNAKGLSCSSGCSIWSRCKSILMWWCLSFDYKVWIRKGIITCGWSNCTLLYCSIICFYQCFLSINCNMYKINNQTAYTMTTSYYRSYHFL